MRQSEVIIVDSIGTLLHAVCEIVSSNDYLARLVPDVARMKLSSKKGKKKRKREGKRENSWKKKKGQRSGCIVSVGGSHA